MLGTAHAFFEWNDMKFAVKFGCFDGEHFIDELALVGENGNAVDATNLLQLDEIRASLEAAAFKKMEKYA